MKPVKFDGIRHITINSWFLYTHTHTYTHRWILKYSWVCIDGFVCMYVYFFLALFSERA